MRGKCPSIRASTQCLFLLLSWTSAIAAPDGTSYAIKFAANETNGRGGTSRVDGAAGVLRTGNWNNFSGFRQTSPQALSADINGVINASSAIVTWDAFGTWSSTGRGPENNTATGEDRDLMAGYLDTQSQFGTGVTININNLPTGVVYDLYVYISNDWNGRGGTYRVGSMVKEHVLTEGFNGTYREDIIDPGSTPGSNYLLFRGLPGGSFTLSSRPTIAPSETNPARAGVSAIEIVVAPEPGILLALIAASAIVSRRQRRR